MDVDYSKVITWGSFLSTNYYLFFLFCYILVSFEKYILDYLKMDSLFFYFFYASWGEEIFPYKENGNILRNGCLLGSSSEMNHKDYHIYSWLLRTWLIYS